MGQGSTRTVAGNTRCCERSAEWQAVSPPPCCQFPVWLLSICHSLTQPTHSSNPSLGLFWRSPTSLAFSTPLSLFPFFFNLSFSWLMFELVGPVTAPPVCSCLRKYFFGLCWTNPWTISNRDVLRKILSRCALRRRWSSVFDFLHNYYIINAEFFNNTLDITQKNNQAESSFIF